MKKLIFCMALLTGATGTLCAQNGYDYAIKESKKTTNLTPTERRFNAPSYNDIQDFVYLKNGKMIFELRDVHDYSNLTGIDTILQHLQEDIGFYRDSLENGSGNVRIDYSVTLGKEQREIRFTKFRQKGEPFIIRNGQTERLKIEQDTIRIVVHDMPYRKDVPAIVTGNGKTISVNPIRWIYPVQITLLVNNYTDLAKVISEKEVLLRAMDTLARARNKKQTNQPYSNPSSCIYRPYVKDSLGIGIRFVKFPYKIEREYGQFSEYRMPHRHFAFYANMGMGVTRNMITPSADAGITYLKHVRNSNTTYYFTCLYVSPLFFFERDANREFYVHDNWFINLVSGNSFDEEILGFKLRGISLGGGYLALQNGDYFKGTTIKVFAGLRMMSGLTLYPEVIATNNFKQIFPGMTLKVFGFKRES
jgi:hypothetical protein